MAGMLEREEWKAFSDFIALVAAGVLRLGRLDPGRSRQRPGDAPFTAASCSAPPVSPFSISSRK